MSNHHYYPQLRWKPAEYESLQVLSATVIDGLTPIINVLDIDWDYINDCYKKSLQDYLLDFGDNLARSWNPERPVFLDVGNLDQHGSSTIHPLDICISDARRNGKEIIPVYSPLYSSDYLNAVKRNITNGVAISLKPSDIPLLASIVQGINIHTDFIDIIINLDDISNASLETQQYTAQVINYVLAQANWRRIILSSTCYPSSQAGIPQHSVYCHKREEWELWTKVIQSQHWRKTPGFSDYPTSSASVTSIDPRFMSQYVSVRYSDINSWIFVKGTAARGNGWGQTQQLCDILVKSGYYFNPQYSWGDQYIYDRAQGVNSSGGSKEWRKVAHSHHLTLVVEQLYNYSQQFPAQP